MLNEIRNLLECIENGSNPSTWCIMPVEGQLSSYDILCHMNALGLCGRNGGVRDFLTEDGCRLLGVLRNADNG